MNDLQLNEITVSYELPKITAELAPLRESVEAIKKQYKGFVVGEDDIDQAKKLIAQLNKSAKSISDKRIEIAKAIKAPIDAFEAEVKALTKEVETLSAEIKAQTDDYEAKRKEAKRKLIVSDDAWAQYMTFNDAWLNKTFAIEDVLEDLRKQREVHDNNVILIEATCNGLGLDPDRYTTMLDSKVEITKIIAQINNDDEVQKRYAKKQAEALNEKPIILPPNAPQPQVAPITPQDTADTDTYTLTLRFTTSKTKLKMLRQFVDENGIKYEKVE